MVNVALPALQTSLNASAVDLQWIVEAYLLFLAALLLVGGSLGDHYGRRTVFLIGVAVFAAASLACGLAGTTHQLIVARAFQGIGAALLVPGSLAIISSSFSEEERGRAIGTWSGLSAITTAVGPVLGGWLVEHVSWRAVFFINIPIALAVIVISLRHVPETAEKNHARVDIVGAILATFGFGGVVYGLVESSHLGFSNRSVVVSMVAGCALLGGLLLVEARVRNPMLPLSLFQSPTFAGANLLTLFLYAALSGAFFFLPLNLIQVQNYSATAAGAALLPFIILMSLLSRWSGGLVGRYGSRLPLVLGPLLTAAGYVLFMFPGTRARYLDFLPAIATLGLGMAISVAPLTTTVMACVSEEKAGVASGVNNAVSRLAGLLAIAVLGIVMLSVFSQRLEQRLKAGSLPEAAVESVLAQRTRLAGIHVSEIRDSATQSFARQAINESFVAGFRTVMGIGAALAAAGAASALFLIRSQNTEK